MKHQIEFRRLLKLSLALAVDDTSIAMTMFGQAAS